MINNSTLGKQKRIIGFRELVDDKTGEIVISNEIEHEIKDINWEKIWLDNLLYAIGIVSDKGMRVLSYFLENRDYENKVLANKEMIIRHTGISRGTVYPIIKKLIEGGVIKELDLGFQVNPDIIFNTSEAKRKKIRRLDVILSYNRKEIKESKTYEVFK